MLQLMSNWLICIDCRWQGRKRDGIRGSVDGVQFGLDYCCWRWVLQYMQCRSVIFSLTRDDGNNDFFGLFICLFRQRGLYRFSFSSLFKACRHSETCNYHNSTSPVIILEFWFCRKCKSMSD